MAKATNANLNETPPPGETPAVETKVRFVTLANPGTSFVDPDTDFRLVNDEVKELGEDAGKLTLTWLRNGGLIEAANPGKKAKQ